MPGTDAFDYAARTK